MNKILLIGIVVILSACVQDPPKGPQVYTTAGSPGGVSYSNYEVTPI